MASINENADNLLKEKQYYKKGEKKWADICKRVSEAIAQSEETNELKKKVQKDIYKAMNNLDFIFSTPCLLNADKNQPGQLSSCFIAETRDNIEDICQMDAEFAKIFQRNGGVGSDLSVLRPAKTEVETSKGYAGGVITFMKKYDSTADEMTKFNPSRKGAIKVNMQDWHPQIKEFIHCKDNLDVLNRMNISISFSDEFMNAVKNDLDWNLEFPDYKNNKEIYNKEWNGNLQEWKEKGYSTIIHETLKARDLFREFCESSWKTGEPGVNYQDTMNRANKNPHLSTLIYTNPCSEFSNIPYSSCNLGSINLSNMVEDEEFDWEKLASLTSNAIRWLDDMIAVNVLPLEKIDKITKAIRPVGLGIMGLADAMYKLNIRYNSQSGYELAERIIKTMKETAIGTSIALAEEKGEYPAWKGSVWEKCGIKLRNSNLLSIAPTGSISFIADTSGGCEPNFGLTYSRRTYDGNIYYITNKVFKKVLEDKHIYSDELMKKIEDNHGSCQGIKEIPKKIRDVFVTAHDLTPREHVDIVSIVQEYVDLSLSKSVNFSNNATVEDIFEIYRYAWEKKLKGLSIYRDGSRLNQTLDTNRKDQQKEEYELFDNIKPVDKRKIGKTFGSTDKFTTACGSFYLTINRDKKGNIVETFVNTSKNGTCKSNIDGLNRMISLALRSGIKVEAIVKQLKGISCSACTRVKIKKVKEINGMSCPDIIGKALLEEYKQDEETIDKNDNKKYKNKCPDCDFPLIYEGGCVSCNNCGFSKCG